MQRDTKMSVMLCSSVCHLLVHAYCYALFIYAFDSLFIIRGHCLGKVFPLTPPENVPFPPKNNQRRDHIVNSMLYFVTNTGLFWEEFSHFIDGQNHYIYLILTTRKKKPILGLNV